MSDKKEKELITIRGARVHNLKNIDLDIPHNRLIVITGLSGSGKSTLAFDTIFAEGQRRYVESLSAYTRQFMGKIEKPDVDDISGIAPAIAIEQRVGSRNPRSTVGTTTEIYDYLRLLYARIGHTISPKSGNEVRSHSIADILAAVDRVEVGQRVVVAAPIMVKRPVGYLEKLTLIVRDGFQRLITKKGEIVDVNIVLQNTDKYIPGNQYIVVDRFIGGEHDKPRVLDSAERALGVGEGGCVIFVEQSDGEWRVEHYSTRFEADGITFERPTEHLFSYNNPLGACPRCEGYGKIVGIDEGLVVPDKSKTIFDDAIVCWRGETMSEWKHKLILAANQSEIPIHKPFYKLSREQKQLIWTGDKNFKGLNAFFRFLEKERYKVQYRVMLSRYTGRSTCPDCLGGRLRKEATYVQIGGRTIVELSQMPIRDLIPFFDALTLDSYDHTIGERVLSEIKSRLRYLSDVGLDYLTLDRQTSTLSGGESQRINLSTSLGSSLVGSLYILDEPSIGLHPRDNQRLISVLRQLRDMGNTVIVVEHEREVIDAADILIDMGPFAGEYGGEVVWNGAVVDMTPIIAERSLTAAYLLGIEKIEVPPRVRQWRNFIEISGARENNLKNVTVKFPLGVITCVTGVSGSGKSSLVGDILYPALRREMLDTGNRPGDFDSITGDVKRIKGVEFIDQNPIGKGARSNPVTYIKAYDEIRRLFSDLPAARAQRLDPSSFSFNIAGGRCEECKGDGVIKVEMQFMADITLMCDVCSGKRFKDSVLDVRYHDRSIYDVLNMSVDEAIAFFGGYLSENKTNSKIIEKLQVLSNVGLGYIKLGQSSSTLSGGESQRVKLASFLLKENSAGPLFFIFDEPTTGLHFHDIKKLLIALNSLVDNGHTVVIVEHNMDVIKCADHVIDMGPEAGDRGGSVVFEGTPQALTECKESYTGQFLSKELAR